MARRRTAPMSEALRETGAGVIGAARVIETRRRGFRDVTWQPPALARDERWTAIDQRGATVLLTGLPASGKSTIALLSLISPMAAHRAHLRGVHEHADTPVRRGVRRHPRRGMRAGGSEGSVRARTRGADHRFHGRRCSVRATRASRAQGRHRDHRRQASSCSNHRDTPTRSRVQAKEATMRSLRQSGLRRASRHRVGRGAERQGGPGRANRDRAGDSAQLPRAHPV